MNPTHLLLAVTVAALSARAEPSKPSGDSAAPASLQQRIASLAEPFGERAGIAVQSVEDGWSAAVNGDRPFQQQSVFKTWVAAVALDAIDRGSLRWDEPIRIERADLIFPYQPIEKEVGPDGRAFTVEELVRWSVIHSDNPSVDALLKRLGGPSAVQPVLDRMRVSGIRIDVGERELHAMSNHGRAELAAASSDAKRACLSGSSAIRGTPPHQPARPMRSRG
jgi:beta-lactamase class A